MKKLVILLILLTLCFGVFASNGLSAGFSISPYIYENIQGNYNYRSSYGAGARVDFDYSPIKYLNTGFSLMTTYNYFDDLNCHRVPAYYAIGRIGGYYDITERSRVGIDSEFAFGVAHLHPTSKIAFTLGAQGYYKYAVSSTINLKTSVDTLWTLNKADMKTQYSENKVFSFIFIPQIGVEVKF